MIFDTLSYVGSRLNASGILWAVGASILLKSYNLVDAPNDIDLLVHTNDIEKADSVLRLLGQKKVSEVAHSYATKYFYEYTIDNIDVDVMSGLILNHSAGSYEHIFDKNSIGDIQDIDGIKIPLSTLEDWYVLYQLIPNREVKVMLIENYLIKNGVKRPDLLKRALTRQLPQNVMENIMRMLNL